MEQDATDLVREVLANFPWTNYMDNPAEGKWVDVLTKEIINKLAEHMAKEIERELVCCGIYDRINSMPHYSSSVNLKEIFGNDYHSICHWGGYAAAIARSFIKDA